LRLYAHFRRIGIIVLLWFALVAPASATSELDVDAALADRIAGDPAAPVTIVEYASFTCPLCAAFHIGADYDGLIERYIETGRVKLIYRDFPLDGVSLRASIAARCADTQDYFDVVRALYETQRDWASAENPTAALAEIAGLDQSMLNACLDSAELSEGLIRMRQRGAEAGVQFTPTYIVNGTVYPGSRSIDEFSEIIDPLVADN
jgi:protein-disulfide isomerase